MYFHMSCIKKEATKPRVLKPWAVNFVIASVVKNGLFRTR
jgi:hypothetical protein